MDRPKSPCRMLPRKTAYCTSSGRSSPSSCRTRKVSDGGASGGSSSGAGSPDSRMTTKTTEETSHSATSVRTSRYARNAPKPRIVTRGDPRGAPDGLGAPHVEVEAPDIELLVAVWREAHVFLHPVVFGRLDHRYPRQVLERDLGHPLVVAVAKALVHAEARLVAQLVELRLPPVILGTARPQKPPHHAVGIPERGGRVRPEQPLEALVAVLFCAHRVLDDLDDRVDPGVLPHRRDRLRHRLVVGQIPGRRLDDHRLVLVVAFLELGLRLRGIVR